MGSDCFQLLVFSEYLLILVFAFSYDQTVIFDFDELEGYYAIECFETHQKLGVGVGGFSSPLLIDKIQNNYMEDSGSATIK